MWWSSSRRPGRGDRRDGPGSNLIGPRPIAASAADGAAKAAAGILLALLLCACGFQLRGEPTTTGLKSIHVPGGGVAQEIRRSLAGSPTRVTQAPTDAEAVLRLLSEHREKTVQTVTSAGRVYEFQLTLAVRYELVAPGREVPVIPPTEAIARRLITYSETAPIAKENEEQLLFRDMQIELADRILRQVAVARRDM